MFDEREKTFKKLVVLGVFLTRPMISRFPLPPRPGKNLYSRIGEENKREKKK